MACLNFGLSGYWGREIWIKEPSCLVFPALYKRVAKLILIQVVLKFLKFVSKVLVITEYHLCFMVVCNYVWYLILHTDTFACYLTVHMLCPK